MKSTGLVMGLMTLWCVSASVYSSNSQETRPPLGCKNVGYQFDLKLLELKSEAAGERNSLYFIFNKSSQSVHLHHTRQDEESSKVHLNHTLKSQNWGALSTCEPNLQYICTIEDKNYPYGKIVDCRDVLQVCEYENVVYGLNNRGNHWIVDNASRNQAVRDVVRYGIIPK